MFLHASAHPFTHITVAQVFKLPIVLQLQINTMDDLIVNMEKRFYTSLLLNLILIVPGNSVCEWQPLQKKVNYRRITVISGLPTRTSAAVASDLYRVAPLLRLGNNQELHLSGKAQPQRPSTAEIFNCKPFLQHRVR